MDKKLGRSDSAIIVVSPLVSLMIDQVTNLKSKGVDAAIMSSPSERVSEHYLPLTTVLVRANYSSPEALQRGRWRECLRNPVLFSIIVLPYCV